MIQQPQKRGPPVAQGTLDSLPLTNYLHCWWISRIVLSLPLSSRAYAAIYDRRSPLPSAMRPHSGLLLPLFPLVAWCGVGLVFIHLQSADGPADLEPGPGMNITSAVPLVIRPPRLLLLPPFVLRRYSTGDVGSSSFCLSQFSATLLWTFFLGAISTEAFP